MKRNMIIGTVMLTLGFILFVFSVIKDYQAKSSEKSLFGLKPIGVASMAFGVAILGFNIWKEVQSAKSEKERREEIEAAQADRRELKQLAIENQKLDSIDRTRVEADRNIKAVSGKLCTFYSEQNDDYFIYLGTNVAMYSKSFLKTNSVKLLGGDVNTDFGFQFGRGCNPIIIGLEKQEVVVSGTFRDYTGSFSALLEKNNWRKNPENRFMINRDECAIEVVDDKLVPVLRIEYIDENRLHISGIFYCREDGKMIIIKPNGSISISRFRNFNSKEFLDYYIREGEKLPRLFTYTGENWFGKRVD